MIGCGPSDRVEACTGDACTGSCKPGQKRDCYDGKEETLGVGPCVGGEQTCTEAGQWGNCVGEVVPVGETCGDGIDNNCNASIDENEDRDGDGFNTCAGDCCDSTECSDPKLVNPTAFDAAGNNVDDDCNGLVDDTVTLCDQNLMSNSADGMDYAKAMDICQTATMNDKKWGVIDATFTLADGTGAPEDVQRSIRPKFGTNALPRGGLNLAMLSTGHAAAPNDQNPGYYAFVGGYTGANSSGFPSDWYMANNNALPNAPGCPAPDDTEGANDPIMLTMHIRVPSNAHSFSLKTNFYSGEFPEFTCSVFNDFFVVLLDSAYTGNPTNPTDKNLAFFTSGANMNYPVGVNLAAGDTGLFTQCINGEIACYGDQSNINPSITTCVSTDDLVGTGFDTPASQQCDSNSLMGGATGWLTTSGNVVPGEVITLRIAIWDTSDHRYDSLALIDGFQWSVDSTQPGTVILRGDKPSAFVTAGAPLSAAVKPLAAAN